MQFTELLHFGQIWKQYEGPDESGKEAPQLDFIIVGNGWKAQDWPPAVSSVSLYK